MFPLSYELKLLSIIHTEVVHYLDSRRLLFGESRVRPLLITHGICVGQISTDTLSSYRAVGPHIQLHCNSPLIRKNKTTNIRIT